MTDWSEQSPGSTTWSGVLNFLNEILTRFINRSYVKFESRENNLEWILGWDEEVVDSISWTEE